MGRADAQVYVWVVWHVAALPARTEQGTPAREQVHVRHGRRDALMAGREVEREGGAGEGAV